MFAVKICGITRVRDANTAVDAGADAIGLNFFDGSPRYVAPSRAASIVAQLPSVTRSVGVFVNALPSDITRIVEEVRLDMVQLHGDEPPEMIAQLAPYPVIRAFRLRERGLDPIHEYLGRCERLGHLPQAVLIDAYQPGQFGGTGRIVDWESLRNRETLLRGMPLVLAGGLGPDNVVAAIESANPDAVDTASGVEERPGVKSESRVLEFVRAARCALGRRH